MPRERMIGWASGGAQPMLSSAASSASPRADAGMAVDRASERGESRVAVEES